MKAETQYNDYVGTVAADISDHIDLNQFLSNRGVSIENYETIGVRFFSSSIGGFSASIICIDKAQSDNNKNHVVQLDFEKELNPEEFFSLFKRFEVILIQDSGKYKDCEIDERRTV